MNWRSYRRAARLAVALGLAGSTAGCSIVQGQAAQDPSLSMVERVLSSTPLFDGHNDLPWAIRDSDVARGDVAAYGLEGRSEGQTDIARLRAGRIGAQFWSVYVPADVEGSAAAMQVEQIEIARGVFARYPEVFAEVRNAEEVIPAFRQGRIASALGMEGGHVIENSLENLRRFYDLGARYLTLTHSANTDWADAATASPEHGGLTEFGKEVVREMNRLGMLVDLSHVAPETMHDALDVSEAPVIFSHSSARGVVDVARNVPDDVLRRLPENGGIVMITFVPGFVSRAVAEWNNLPPEERDNREPPRATIEDVILHIEHVRDVAGIDHVGIGADYDGIGTLPVGLEDVSTYPRLFEAVARRGWSEGDLRKLAGENILRVWREAEIVAASLQRTRTPSTATIEQLDQ